MFKHNLTKKDLYCSNVIELRKVTLENMIKKYGLEKGTEKWEQYKQRQAYSNSFEYKQKRYGWTLEQYEAYNQTRASTKENFIKRHGKEEGTRLWNEYRKKQSYAGVTEEYFVEKYGEAEGVKKFKEVCSQKSNTLDSFIKKYGEIIGTEKWNRLSEKRATYKIQSNLANELFEELLKRLPTERHINIFFDSKNHEYFFAKKGVKTIFVDFYDSATKKVIEFAGDYWHGNPQKYEPTFYNPQAKATAQELYESTIKRNEMIEAIHGCKVLLIWETDYKQNKDLVINNCIDFLNESAL
jgi:hypothetical protein